MAQLAGFERYPGLFGDGAGVGSTDGSAPRFGYGSSTRFGSNVGYGQDTVGGPPPGSTTNYPGGGYGTEPTAPAPTSPGNPNSVPGSSSGSTPATPSLVDQLAAALSGGGGVASGSQGFMIPPTIGATSQGSSNQILGIVVIAAIAAVAYFLYQKTQKKGAPK